jgi:ABC-type antimicrobial peptide transport system permease subunit
MAIGTAAIVVMMSLGIGINEYFRESIERTGSMTTITVTNYRTNYSSDGMAEVYVSGLGGNDEIVLDNKAVESIEKIGGVVAVMPLMEYWGQAVNGQYYAHLNIMGVDIDKAELFEFSLAEGRMPSKHAGSAYEIVFGSWTLREFTHKRTYRQAVDAMGNPKLTLDSRFQLTFDYSNILSYDDMGMGQDGATVSKGKLYKLRPVGVMSEESNNYAWYSLMDIEAVKKLAKENKAYNELDTSRYSQIWVKCADTGQVLDIQNQIMALGYGATSAQDTLNMVTEQFASLQLLLGAIGSVSLLIAAIGIMNTMMMSIYERTKEIGIIKVLGCRMGNIAGQFLTEAAYIGLFGGSVGLAVSYGLSALLNMFVFAGDDMGIGSVMRSVIPMYLSAGAVGFSIVVALLSGMYPALRAMRLSALTAIRNE